MVTMYILLSLALGGCVGFGVGLIVAGLWLRITRELEL